MTPERLAAIRTMVTRVPDSRTIRWGDATVRELLAEVERLTRERDDARDAGRRIYAERISFWKTPGPEYLSRLGLPALPDWLDDDRCGAMGPPSLCGDEGRQCGSCELPRGHRNAYHRDGNGWWLDEPATDAAVSAAAPEEDTTT